MRKLVILLMVLSSCVTSEQVYINNVGQPISLAGSSYVIIPVKQPDMGSRMMQDELISTFKAALAKSGMHENQLKGKYVFKIGIAMKDYYRTASVSHPVVGVTGSNADISSDGSSISVNKRNTYGITGATTSDERQHTASKIAYIYVYDKSHTKDPLLVTQVTNWSDNNDFKKYIPYLVEGLIDGLQRSTSGNEAHMVHPAS